MDRVRVGMRAVTAGAVGNGALAALKIFVGLYTHASAVTADGVHNVADLGASLAVYIGLRVSGLPPDREHAYGHQKAESVAAKIVAILLILAGFELLTGAIGGLRTGPQTVPGLLAFWVMVGSLVVKLGLWVQGVRVGRRAQSKAVLAGARDHQVDVYTSAVALVAVLVSRLGWPPADNIGALVVSLFVLRAGWMLLREAIDDLMDKFDDETFIRSVRDVVGELQDVRVQGIRARRMGHQILLDIDIGVPGFWQVQKGHERAHAVSRRLMGHLPEVAGVHVHVNPLEEGAEGDAAPSNE